jgi:hypothetical protein
MPCAICAGLPWPEAGFCEPKISIMPTMVPKRPSSVETVAIDPAW